MSTRGSYSIECPPCGASLTTPLLSAAVRFDSEHADHTFGGAR